MAEPTTINGATSSPATEQNDSTQNAIIVHPQRHQAGWLRRWRGAFLTAGLALFIGPLSWFGLAEQPIDPTDYAARTKRVLKQVPLIDGHNDLPWMLRVELHNRIYDGKFNPRQKLLGHTDVQRMRQGMMGGQFWSVYVHCDAAQKHFEDPSVSELLGFVLIKLMSGLVDRP